METKWIVTIILVVVLVLGTGITLGLIFGLGGRTGPVPYPGG